MRQHLAGGLKVLPEAEEPAVSLTPRAAGDRAARAAALRASDRAQVNSDNERALFQFLFGCLPLVLLFGWLAWGIFAGGCPDRSNCPREYMAWENAERRREALEDHARSAIGEARRDLLAAVLEARAEELEQYIAWRACMEREERESQK